MFAYCCNNPTNYSDPSGSFPLAIGFVLLLAGITAGLTGCTTEENENWPENCPYSPEDPGSGINQQNCYTYAFDYPVYFGDPGCFSDNPSIYVKERYTTESLRIAVEADAREMQKNLYWIPSPDCLPPDATLVVAKISEDGDYHFAVRVSDECWVDKPGAGKPRCNSITSFDADWTIDDPRGLIVYTSDPIFFAYLR